VIGQLISNLHELDYPKELYDIYVIADNCTDDTAKVAAASGANVIVRFNDVEKGKGYAMEYAFEQIIYNRTDDEYDAVVVFDADNLVSKNFLMVMNAHLLQGEKIIQGFLDTKNPADTWVTKAIYITYTITSRFLQLAKYNLGFTCALGGTGMCLSTEVLKKYGWGMTSLTEDLEFQTKALMHNIKVTWAHDAKVFDEKPLTIAQSLRQRKRWMQGHTNVAERYMGKLLWQGIVTKNLAMIDGALYLVQPFFWMFTGVVIFLNMLSLPFRFTYSLEREIIITIIAVVFQLVYFSLGLFLSRVKPQVFLWLLYFPIFALTWIPVAFVGFAQRKQKVWNHTLHIRNIRHEQLKSFNITDDSRGS
jgi:cellulose synthase/poly-beta-1,6-N-acetylglucosamine synthase-like glycosyltransferase